MASGMSSNNGWSTSSGTCGVYLPYGNQWYGYFARRLAERPANLAFFLRSLIPGNQR